jgi:hypothetical protein
MPLERCDRDKLLGNTHLFSCGWFFDTYLSASSAFYVN